MTEPRELTEATAFDFDAAWPTAHGWAIAQMPCPAYCCTADGAIVRCNGAAERLWGWRPPDDVPGLWHGFDAVRDGDGQPLEHGGYPAALAASGAEASEMELAATCRDGQVRRIVSRAKAVRGPDGSPRGVLCVLIDVTERWRREQEMREALAGRTHFLTVLAHELRNPLSPIMSAARLLHRKSADPATTRLAEMVDRQARTLARFISDLLDGSRIENLWDLHVVPRTCLLSDILERAMETVRPDLQFRKQSVAVDAAPIDATLWCDPKRVAQALANVLANASKFTPDGGAIRLSPAIEGRSLRIEVADRGPGVAPAELARLFTPFAAHPTAPGRAPSGAGIGLAIARSVCEAHGGTIAARPADSGEGTVFTLSLPIVSSGG